MRDVQTTPNPWGLSAGMARVMDALLEHGNGKTAARVLGVSVKTVEEQCRQARKRMGTRRFDRTTPLLLWDRWRRQPAVVPANGVLLHLVAVPVAEQLPDADTDVLIFDGADPEGQLGAYVGHDEVGPIWVDAQGQGVAGVTHWAELPRLVKAEDLREGGAA
jgi:hypothetical protein